MDQVSGQLHLVNSLVHRGKFDSAQELLESVSTRSVRWVLAKVHLLFRKGELRNARELVVRELELPNTARDCVEIQYWRAKCDLALNPEEQEKVLSTLEGDEDAVKAVFAGILMFEMGRNNEALLKLEVVCFNAEKSGKLTIWMLKALVTKARIWISLGRFQKAMEELNRAEQSAELVEFERFEDQDDLIEILQLKSLILFEDEDFNLALESVEKAISLDGEGRRLEYGLAFRNTDILHHIKARCLYRLNQFERAVKEFTSVLQCNSDIEALYFRARCYAKLDLKEKAIRDFSYLLKEDPNNYKSWLGRGLIQMKISDRKSFALRDFSKAIALQPTEAFHAYFYRGQIHRESEEYEEAIDDFNHALEIQPSSLRAREARSAVYLAQGLVEKAIKEYTSVIDEHLGGEFASLEALQGRGLAYLRSEQYDKALEDFSLLLKESHYTTDVYNYRGATYFCMHNYEEAIEDYSSSIKANPQNVAAFFERGRCMLYIGNYLQSIDDFESALLLCRNSSADAFYLKGLSQVGAGLFSAAIVSFGEALKLQPKHYRALASRGVAHNLMDKFEASTNDLSNSFLLWGQQSEANSPSNFRFIYSESMLEEKPNSKRPLPSCCWFVRGHSYLNSKAYEKCIMDMELYMMKLAEESLRPLNHLEDTLTVVLTRISSLNIDNPFWYLGMANLSSGNFQKAVDDFSKSISLLSDEDIKMRHEAFLSRGRAFISLNKFPEALKDLTEAIHIDNAYASAYVQRAFVLKHLDALEEAYHDMHIALNIDSKSTDVLIAAAKLHFDDDKFTEAMEYIDAALLKDESLPQCYFLKAAIEIANSDIMNAIRDLDQAIDIDATFFPAVHGRAKCSMVLGKFDEAAQFLSQALELNPSSSEVYMDRSEVFQRLGLTLLAKQDLKKVAELEKESLSQSEPESLDVSMLKFEMLSLSNKSALSPQDFSRPFKTHLTDELASASDTNSDPE